MDTTPVQTSAALVPRTLVRAAALDGEAEADAAELLALAAALEAAEAVTPDMDIDVEPDMGAVAVALAPLKVPLALVALEEALSLVDAGGAMENSGLDPSTSLMSETLTNSIV